jgi:hypothetical protein
MARKSAAAEVAVSQTRTTYDRARTDDETLLKIMRKMPDEVAVGKIQKLVNAIRAEGLSASMARVERLISAAAPAKKVAAKKAVKADAAE